MKKEEGFNLKNFVFGSITRRVIVFFLAFLIVISSFFMIILYEINSVRSEFLTEANYYGNLTLSEQKELMVAIGKLSIAQRAENVARTIEVYIQAHPEMTVMNLQNDTFFQSIAVQPVGKTGYTALTDVDTLICRFHYQNNIVNLDLSNLARKLPGFWEIMAKTKGGVNAEGFYDWQEPNGEIKQKYMYIKVVNATTQDGVVFSVAATTYLEEIYSSVDISTRVIQDYLRDVDNTFLRYLNHFWIILFLLYIFLMILLVLSILFVNNSISKPLKQLTYATKALETGNYNVTVHIDSNDELGILAESFNKTIKSLKVLDEQKNEIDKAKTEFLSITSHELRSPMTPMKAQLQMLLKGYFGELNKKQIEAIDIVLNNTNRLDKIIVDFLEISRIEAARLKFNFIKTSLTPHILELMHEMKGYLPEKKVKIELKIGKLPIMDVDPDRVMQVLRNIVNNAIKFSNPGGRVIVSVDQKGKFIYFSIQDFGIGISKENQIKIFEPFFQEEQTIFRTYQGVGLGLAICRGIVESQNGQIYFESEKGKGTKFSFTIPIVPVKNIAPIRLLFSSKEAINRGVLEIFEDMLGPLGKKEFNQLYLNKKINHLELINYIHELNLNKVLSQSESIKFENEIKDLFAQRGVIPARRSSAEEKMSNIFK